MATIIMPLAFTATIRDFDSQKDSDIQCGIEPLWTIVISLNGEEIHKIGTSSTAGGNVDWMPEVIDYFKSPFR